MVLHWHLNDSKSPQVSRTLLSILTVLNNVVVWMVSNRLPTSKSSCLFSHHLVSVSKAPITIGIVVTYMLHSFFRFPCKFEIFILLFTFFQFYSVVSRDSEVDYYFSPILFFFSNSHSFSFVSCLVNWGCKIHRLLFCKTPTSVLDTTLNYLIVMFQ